MPDEWVLVHTTADSMQAEMLAELLEAEGIEVELAGPRNPALLGAAAHIVPVSLRVAAPDAEAARDLLAAALGEPATGSDADRPAEAAADPSRGLRSPSPVARLPRRSVVGAGAALVVPGGSHYYAGRPWTGLVLTVSFGAALLLLARSDGSHEAVSTWALALVTLVLGDLVGGLRALRLATRRAGGATASRARQLAAGLLLGLGSFGVAVLLGPRLPPPERKPGDADLELLRLWQEQEPQRGRRADPSSDATQQGPRPVPSDPALPTWPAPASSTRPGG